MMNQESEEEFSQEIPASFHENGVDSVALNGFTVLKLPQLQPATAAANTSISDPATKPLRKCSSCGSAKKRSPPPSHSSFYEPSSKRAAISATNPSSPYQSPPSSAERKRDTLRRSLSDFPCSPGAYQDFQNSAATLNSQKNPLSPSSMLGNSKNPLALLESQDSFPMVPQPPPLHMSPSNPFSSEYEYDPAVNTTPPRRPPAISRPHMFHHQGSPNPKKMRELKERVEELMQLMGQVDCEQQEQEDEDTHQNDVNINCINKGKAEMNQTHDSVWVKQIEGGLILHFKCPCGEGYEVFLHREKCYYRLT